MVLFRKEWGREVRGYSLKEEEAVGVPFKCVSEQRQRSMQIISKEHLKQLTSRMAKGFGCYLVRCDLGCAGMAMQQLKDAIWETSHNS